MKEGWICPRCGKVNAPFMMSCDCKSSSASNFSKDCGYEDMSCQHEWKSVMAGSSTDGCWTWARCRKCGKQKQVFTPRVERAFEIE